MIFVVLLLLLIGGMAAWGLLDPASQWRVTQSWQYRHPGANEPSNAAYTVQRVVCLVVLVVVAIVLFRL